MYYSSHYQPFIFCGALFYYWGQQWQLYQRQLHADSAGCCEGDTNSAECSGKMKSVKSSECKIIEWVAVSFSGSGLIKYYKYFNNM
jgi:hypothetical protein